VIAVPGNPLPFQPLPRSTPRKEPLMAKHEQQETDKTPAEVEDRIWELARKIDFCMFVSWDGERQQARPLSSRVERDEHAIYFLVSATGTKNEQIAQYPVVNLAYADTGGMKYLSISGSAAISNDRAKIKDLWSDFDKARWEDENDPDIRLLTVTPETGELWDSPGKAVAFATMVAAAITGAKADFGDNATVRM
jgi:general stress protein 26